MKTGDVGRYENISSTTPKKIKLQGWKPKTEKNMKKGLLNNTNSEFL